MALKSYNKKLDRTAIQINFGLRRKEGRPVTTETDLQPMITKMSLGSVNVKKKFSKYIF